jgi:hypothetical protein
MAWSSGGDSARVGDCSWPAPVICEGLVPSPAKSHKVALVDCACHWANSLAVGSCGALGELGCGLPISRRTTKCWSAQRGRSVSASTWTSGEKLIVSSLVSRWLALLIGIIIVIGDLLLQPFFNVGTKDQSLSCSLFLTHIFFGAYSCVASRVT